jgi:nicotinamidase-related amidase
MASFLSSADSAVLVIDLQRENMTAGAWPVAEYNQVLRNARTVIDQARMADIPIIYTRH